MLKNSLRTGAKLCCVALLAIAASAAHAATHQVSIQGFAFNPATIDAAVGDTIVFTNNDNAPHTATALDGSFDTGRINGGNSGEVTISAAGSIEFRCNFHSSMTGQVNAQ